MSDRYDDLAPKHLVATLRSLRRRWNEVIGPVRSDPELFARIGEAGPDGDSLGDLVSLAARRTESLADATRRLATHDSVRLPADVLTPPPPAGERLAVEVATATLADRADDLADLLDHLAADDWSRVADLEGGSSVDLVTLVRAVARHGVELLRRAETQAEWLRSTA